jgi:ribosomal protein S15P/S13E
MARTHAQGASDGKVPQWVPLDKEEVVEEAVKLARGGASPAQVGAALRDTHGVPSVRLVTGRNMREILKEQGVLPQLPEDLQHLLKRVVHLQRHLAKHPSDLHNKRGLTLIESRIRRVSKYYKSKKVLPADWQYSAETAALQVE